MNDPIDRRTIRAFPDESAPQTGTAIAIDADAGQSGALLWAVGPDGTLVVQHFATTDPLLRAAVAHLENCLDAYATRDGTDHADATLRCSALNLMIRAELHTPPRREALPQPRRKALGRGAAIL